MYHSSIYRLSFFKNILGFLFLFLIVDTTVFAQGSGVLSGIIRSGNGDPAIGAMVQVEGVGKSGQTDENGAYLIDGLPEGSYQVTVSYLGYRDETSSAKVGKGKTTLDFSMQERSGSLDNVTITGLSESEKANRQAYNVAAIDAKKLYNTTLDLAHALDRVPGVRLRESGGVGSNMNFALNGFSGRQIKIFVDGIPMDNFGSSFQINNIPINLAERVEVYKGVVPVWLGADALGGAVNIVTESKKLNYIDVGYSYGSFNTHRSSLNAAVTSKSGFTAQVSLYQNYSDNNYKITLDIADINTGAYTRNATVRRFHDNFHNEMGIINVGVVGKKWADKFLIGFMAGQNEKDIQTGARMEAVFGQRHSFGNILMPTLKYKKQDLFVKGLDLLVNANFNFGKETQVDTASGRYDWYGTFKSIPGIGGEYRRQLYKYGNNTGIATASLNYTVDKHQSLAFNHVYSTFNRKGYDELDPYNKKYAQPQITAKNVTGVSYQYNIENKLTATVFGKMLRQKANTAIAFSGSTASETVYIARKNESVNYGYGIATSYYVVPHIQTKASYERSIRLPDNQELFGDVINTEGNFNLKPEHSHNVNLSFIYSKNVYSEHYFTAGITGIYRYATDYIYMKFTPNQDKYTYDNQEGVKNIGGEIDLTYDYKKRFNISANATYQDIRNMVEFNSNGQRSNVYKDQMPNIPYFYGHLAASYNLSDLVMNGDRLTIGYNMLYVHSFYLYWPSQGSNKLNIPTQLAHDLTVTYTLKNGRYNIAFEALNITNEQLYDNFMLQKPGRNFNLKLRYFYAKM